MKATVHVLLAMRCRIISAVLGVLDQSFDAGFSDKFLDRNCRPKPDREASGP